MRSLQATQRGPCARSSELTSPVGLPAQGTGNKLSGNAHMAEERGEVVDDSGMDEEDRSVTCSSSTTSTRR